MACQACELRAENDRLKAKSEAEWLALGTSLMTDDEGPLPIRVTLNTRPTKEQFRRLLDLTIEIENNPK
ncbi:hypothetical protein OEG84_24970 [Hoeflea sp. G2-23]|uniref:Uncharacterized protein n=1 Tax=Hoeflea algicola TaxID=2983763 RepID=A0ABT3ZGB8_9HYPH|nr:hypothetical protein [Hoeflea algicola]MCY0146155.1 hypothetical protein [Hoeflea algicola]MCY0150860.1 hypothetical protein [Hoeflea algicola]